MMLILELCFRFFCCGLFAVGGGLATLPFLYNISKETGWYTFSDISNMIAVSESTPGPMGVNMATYVGFTTAGPAGAVIATLGLITPSIIVIIHRPDCGSRYRRGKDSVPPCRRGWQPGAFQAVFHHQLEGDRTGACDLVRLSQMEKAPDLLHRGGGCDWNRVPVPLGKIEENRTISRRGSAVSVYSFGVVLFLS